jgi:hypothetical protein
VQNGKNLIQEVIDAIVQMVVHVIIRPTHLPCQLQVFSNQILLTIGFDILDESHSPPIDDL